MKELSDNIMQAASDAFYALHERLRPGTVEYRDATENLLNLLQAFFARVAINYNATIIDEPLRATVRRVAGQDVSKEQRGAKEKGPAPLRRVVVCTALWAVTIRARPGIVECFILPATELPNIPHSELPSRAKLTLKLKDPRLGSWHLNDVVVTSEEMNALMRGLFKDLVARSKADFEVMPEAKLIAGGQSFAGSVRSLVAEKHALVQKIVNQQEAIQNQIARELHDAVLGNVMLLKRYFSGGKKMPEEEIATVLDEIASRLREVCQELSPRDLKDLGIKPLLEELCRNLSTRAGCDSVFNCTAEIPEFPEEVLLHIYRIAQECFNNVSKHASASKVELTITVEKDVFTMCIQDNGVGFDPSQVSARTKEGGSGAGIIKERTELISFLCPARVLIDSQQGKGTVVTLQITLSKLLKQLQQKSAGSAT